MLNKINNLYEVIISRLAPYVILSAGVLLIFLVLFEGRTTNRQNNGYVRVINCIISVPATVRTQEDIDHCYEVVETDLHIKLQRYNNPE